MEGRGVTNFSADKPSHGYTTSTTEFDDQLIQRGIVTTEQVMMAKGASIEEAIRLTEAKKRGGVDTVVKKNWNDRGESTTSDANESDDDDDDSFEDDFDDDDAFLQRYRQQRLDQLKQEQETKKASELSHSQPSSILHIGRDEWREEVNEASFHRWVVITMTEASGERRDRVVQELHRFAREFESSSKSGADDSDSDDDDEDSLDGQRHPQHPGRISKPKLLTINASDAIPNWPAERVPAMFAYRDGVKQQEWIAGRRGEFPPKNILEQLFRKWNVI